MKKVTAVLVGVFAMGLFMTTPSADAGIIRIHRFHRWHHRHHHHHHHHHHREVLIIK